MKDGLREMFIGFKEDGTTLEPQVVKANQDNLSLLNKIVQCPEDEDLTEYMMSNKTEVAWRISINEVSIEYPQYFIEAIEFVKKL